MVDTELLNKKIEDSGLKVSYIVDNLGISRQGFDKKKKNKTPFRVAEIFVLCSLLNIDNDVEKKNIFLQIKLSNISTRKEKLWQKRFIRQRKSQRFSKLSSLRRW